MPGGAGFVGAHGVDRLLTTGHQPVIHELRRSPHHRDGVESLLFPSPHAVDHPGHSHPVALALAALSAGIRRASRLPGRC